MKLCQLWILPTRDPCFNQTRTNLGAEHLGNNGSSERSGRKPRYMCRVRQLLITLFIPVARLIEDKADASSTVNQSVHNVRVVCRELKFDPKYKSAGFRAKYLKSEIESENSCLLCLFCVFAAFPRLWRPIFCLTVDATSMLAWGSGPLKGEGEGEMGRGRGPDTKPLIGSCSTSRIWMLRWLAKRQRSASRGSRQSLEI